MATYYSDMVNRRTCVYRFFDESGDLLYVGISMNLDSRITNHRRQSWWEDVAHIRVEWHQGREAAKAAERAAIAAENPVYNRARPPAMPTIEEVDV